MAQDYTKKPRWAEDPGVDWPRFLELFDYGLSPPELMRQAKLPKSKRRSVQLFVEKWGPFRRHTKVGELKDAMLVSIEHFGRKQAKAMALIAERNLDPNTPPKLLMQGVGMMIEYTKLIKAMNEEDAKAERERKREEKGLGTSRDPGEVIRRAVEDLEKHYAG